MLVNCVVVHDGTIHPGGAVDVVLEAARELNADIVVGFSGPDPEWWERRAPNDVEVLSRRKRTWFIKEFLTVWRMLRLDLSSYDLVLSSGPATKFYQPRDGQRVVHYMHHPPLNFLWYNGGILTYAMKTLDRIETTSIPTVVTNSELTAERLETVYNRETDAVVHPPVDVDRFDPDAEKRPEEVVMVGRLESRKRPSIAVEAFRRFDQSGGNRPQLHLLGAGPLREELSRTAPENVHFHGYVDDDELVRRVERASVGLFLARREDFGITPVEYMAAGTPVVGVDEPNTNRQVSDGETGLLTEPTAESVAGAVEKALDTSWNRNRLHEAARTYDSVTFRRSLTEVINE